MVCHADSRPHLDALPGVRRKTLVHGPRTLLSEFRLTRDAVIPPHRHPHEQTGYLMSGRLQLAIAGRVHDFHPGDAWMIPGDVEHEAHALEDSVIVEVFSPVREDYLP